MDQKTLPQVIPSEYHHPQKEQEVGFLKNHPLTKSLQSRGEKALLKGDLGLALQCFDQALKLQPSDSTIYYNQGLTLFEFGGEEGQEKALLLASRKLKQAITFNPNHVLSWQAWGSVLSALGTHFEEFHYFQDAKEKLDKAIALSLTQPDFDKEFFSELYWELGIVLTRLAEHSEEAFDMHTAIDTFQKAANHEETLPADFWSDFGYAYLKLAGQINDLRLFTKAIECFKRAIGLEGNHFESWSLLGEALEGLYAMTHDEEHFQQANDCFSSATLIEPNDVDLWIHWARFLCNSAKRTSDLKRLRSSVEKCQKVFSLDAKNPEILAVWAETLALLGNYTERLDLLHEAEKKITQAFEIQSDDPDLFYSYGICLQAFGHYFNDLDYYYQAIEKFQAGLSIDRTSYRNWHAIGWTYSLLGDRENDPQALELSLRFLKKAIDLNSSTYYLFDYAVALSKLGELANHQGCLEESVLQFEQLLRKQKNAVYLHPDWLFHYACTLDALGDFFEEDSYYLKAIEIFSHVLMIDPDFTPVHHRLAIALSHLGELTEEVETFYRALHHFRLSMKNDDENDIILLDWATALINVAQYTHDSQEREQCFRDAEHKLLKALHLGNLHSDYLLACLSSLNGGIDRAMHFLLKAYYNNALPTVEEMFQDEWLDDLSSTREFQEFIYRLEQTKKSQEES